MYVCSTYHLCSHNTFKRVDIVDKVCGTIRWLMIMRLKFTAFLGKVWVINADVRLFQLASFAHIILLGEWIFVELDYKFCGTIIGISNG